LGVPVASIYAGKWAAIDERLAGEGRLQKLAALKDVESLMVQKKPGRELRPNLQTRSEVIELILES